MITTRRLGRYSRGVGGTMWTLKIRDWELLSTHGATVERIYLGHVPYHLVAQARAYLVTCASIAILFGVLADYTSPLSAS